MKHHNSKLDEKSVFSPAKRIDQEPYLETADNQQNLKEGVLNELIQTQVD